MQEHVLAGLTTPYILWGNDTADKEALAAHALIDDCEDICLAFYSKQQRYIDFLVALHAMFVRVIRAEKSLRDARVKALGKFVKLKLPHRNPQLLNARPVSMPSCPSPEDGVRIPSLLDTSVTSNLDAHDQRVLSFIRHSCWTQPGQMNSLGSTWLEIMIAYAHLGGTLACADHVLKVPSFHQAIKEFRARVRRLVCLALPTAFHACFAPYGISFTRLSTVGVATLLSGIEGKICMTDTLRKHVFGVIVSVTHNIKARQLDSTLQGRMPVWPSRFPLRQRTDIFHIGQRSNLQELVADGNEPSMPLTNPASFVIFCQHCSHGMDVAGRKLHGPAGWSSLICKLCGIATTARLWLCQCNCAWPSCPKHMRAGYACLGSRVKVRAKGKRTARKRSLHNGTFRRRRSKRIGRRRATCASDSLVLERPRAIFVPPARDDNAQRCKKQKLMDSLSVPTSSTPEICSSGVGDKYTPSALVGACSSNCNVALVPDLHTASAIKRKQADSIVAHGRSVSARFSASARLVQRSLSDSVIRLLTP